MKLLRTIVCLVGMASASCHDHMSLGGNSFGILFAQESAAQVAGAWRLSVDTPHGQMPGTLQLKQEGGKITGSCDIEHMGSMPLTGQVDGKKISFSIEIQGGPKVTFMGAVAGDKMGGSTDHEGGSWSATRGAAQI